LFLTGVKGPNAIISVPAPIVATGDHPLFKKTVVLTGFRDKDLLQKLKDVGATQGTSVSKNTFALIVKQSGETGAKIESAKNAGVPIFFIDDFVQKFFSV
jgi:NAD-dependent DNA ligase